MTTATILIVEDEPLVLAMAADIAEGAGFEVLSACGAEEALEILEQNSQITILFSDVRMPGSMNGKQLACEVARRWPHLKIILTSGYSPDGLGDVPSESYFVAKPYRPDVLERMLHELASPVD